MVVIAVISDLHIGPKARRFDLQPSGKAESGVAPYLDEFSRFVLKEKLSAQYLVVPGDVANAAHPAEYALAGTKINEIAEMLGVTRSNIIFVPGNHDVCWPVQNLGTDFWRSKKFLPMREVLPDTLQHDRADCAALFEPPYAMIRDFGDVLLVLVNSAYKDDAPDPDSKTKAAPHHGSFAPESAAFLEEQLGCIKAHSGFVVLVTHHHILPVVDPDPYWEDFSMMNNSGLLLDLAARANVDLVIHGHKHWPNFQTYQNNPHPLFAVLSAGSFSANIDESLSGRVFNKFHLIEMDGRDTAGNACGKVRSWSYHSGLTWLPSNRENGIASCEPFGFYRSDSDLLLQVRAAHEQAKAAARGPLDVDAVTGLVMKAEYLAQHRLDHALQKVADEANAMLVVEPSSNKRFFVYG